MIKNPKRGNGQITRRRLLKGAATGAGLAVGSGLVKGFPTIWAQNIKDVTLTHVGESYSVIPQIGQQASKDLGFKIDMQTVDYATLLNRLFNAAEHDRHRRHRFFRSVHHEAEDRLPIPVSKYKWWDKTCRSSPRASIPTEGRPRSRAARRSSSSTMPTRTARRCRRPRRNILTSIPTVTNADTLGIRPDLIGRPIDSWAELINPQFKGKAAIVDVPDDRHPWTPSMALESAGADEVRRQGQPDQGRDRQDDRHPDRRQKGRTVPRVLVDVRPVGQPDGLRRGGDPVDVVAGRNRRAHAQHQLRLRSAEGGLSRLGQWRWCR